MNKEKILRIFQPAPMPLPQSGAMLVLRLVSGLAFIFHGWGKIQNPFGWMGEDSAMPGIFQALAAIAEVGGGFAWMIGAVMPLASFGLLCTMVVATYMHAIVRQDPFVGQGGSYELALLYLVIAILYIIAGPGKLSVDAKIFGERR